MCAQNEIIDKQYIPEDQEHLPSSEKHYLPYGEECEASQDPAYISTTRDDSSTSSNPSETSDSSDQEWEDRVNIVGFGEQEESYCKDDTVQQLKAVDKSTLVLDRYAPQPPKPISCSDVDEETGDDSSTSSTLSETSDSSDHEWEDHVNIVGFGEQEESYCKDDTVQQLKAVDKSTLVLDRYAPQPPKPISCSDVDEETGYEPLAKVDNRSTRFSRSPQPSVVNSSQTLKLNDASPLPRQNKPSGKTMISGHMHGVVTNHQKYTSTSDTDKDEDINKPNDHPSTTGSNGEQSNSTQDCVLEDHQPDPFTTVFIVLPDPPGFIAILYLYNINVSESHARH